MDNNNMGYPSATSGEGAAGGRTGRTPIGRAAASLSANAASHSANTAPILIDASEISPSPWANRHPSSYESSEFRALVADIEREGGNTIPIKVRPLPDDKGGSPALYEIVFGHRRHRACLELSRPVLALVEVMTDEQLVCAMHGENMHRKDLSPYERGVAYARMIAEGLFTNQRALAREPDVSAADVSRMLFLARLPQEVIDILHSPLDLSIHSVDKLRPVFEQDKEGVVRRATEIRMSRGTVGAKLAVSLLTGSSDVGASNATSRPLFVAGRTVGTLQVLATRCVRVAVQEPLSESGIDALKVVIEQFLSEHFVEHLGSQKARDRPRPAQEI